MIIQAHLFIKGEGIGVGFRAWTKIQAKQQRINGWVRNVYDKPEVFGNGGGVEVLVQGEQSKVDEMITLLEKGPPIARVDDVEVMWQEPKEIIEGFEIRK
jgi:acylphosphatase